MANNDERAASESSNQMPVEPRLAGTVLVLINTLASIVPGLGGLTSELIGRLRERRIRQFVELLAERINNLENRHEVLTQPACIELLEEAAEQAARGENDIKRTALARLMAASINEDLVNHETDRLLLAILGEMTDYELLHLVDLMRDGPYELDETYRIVLDNAEDILYPRTNLDMAPQKEVDDYEVQRAHLARLERMGLLTAKRDPGLARQDTSELGRILLRRIGAITCTDD